MISDLVVMLLSLLDVLMSMPFGETRYKMASRIAKVLTDYSSSGKELFTNTTFVFSSEDDQVVLPVDTTIHTLFMNVVIVLAVSDQEIDSRFDIVKTLINRIVDAPSGRRLALSADLVLWLQKVHAIGIHNYPVFDSKVDGEPNFENALDLKISEFRQLLTESPSV